jgi:hypothetical protein
VLPKLHLTGYIKNAVPYMRPKEKRKLNKGNVTRTRKKRGKITKTKKEKRKRPKNLEISRRRRRSKLNPIPC